MVNYLVDDLGLDVNALDTGTQDFNHWRTPLCYAVRITHGGEEVVRFLLDRGADPYIKDCWGFHDAFSRAKPVKNLKFPSCYVSGRYRINKKNGLSLLEGSI